MGFVRIFWKNNIQEAYFAKTGISGQIIIKTIIWPATYLSTCLRTRGISQILRTVSWTV